MKTKISFEMDGFQESTDDCENGGITGMSVSIARESEVAGDQYMVEMALEDLITKIQPCRLFSMLASLVSHFAATCPEQVCNTQEQEMITKARLVIDAWNENDSDLAERTRTRKVE